jgi:holo-[acyl-carrier protein] synthase
MSAHRIVGTGIDIVENERMVHMLEKWDDKFKDRVFLSSEQEYCESKAFPASHYAARFAVKEAVSKAFGTGIGKHIGWLDVEVRRNPATGAPAVSLSAKGKALMDDVNADDVLISLSHTHNYAVAQALLVQEDAS